MKNKQLFAVYYGWYARNKKTSTTGIFIHSDTLTESGQIFIFMQISSNGKIMSLALNICLNCEFVVCVSVPIKMCSHYYGWNEKKNVWCDLHHSKLSIILPVMLLTFVENASTDIQH